MNHSAAHDLDLGLFGGWSRWGSRLEPFRQRSRWSVFLKFLSGHSVEQVIKAHLLSTVDPQACSIDFAICLDCCNNCTSRHVNFTRMFDDLLECRADISLSLCEQAKCARMAIHARAISQPEFGSNCRGAPPSDNSEIDPVLLHSSCRSPVLTVIRRHGGGWVVAKEVVLQPAAAIERPRGSTSHRVEKIPSRED